MSIIKTILETAIKEPNLETAVVLFSKAYNKSRGEGNSQLHPQLKKQFSSNIDVLESTIKLNNDLIAASISFEEAQTLLEINFNLIQLKQANLDICNA